MDLEDNSAEIANGYRILATLFMKEPDADTIEHFQEAFQVEVTEEPDEIAADFSGLFFDPAEQLSPYESAYTNFPDTAVTPQDAGGTVFDFYVREGLMIEDNNVVPDHLSAELFFISYLVEAKKREVLKEFLERHAARWIPLFCDDLYESAGTNFYREVASVTKDYILTEYEELSASE